VAGLVAAPGASVDTFTGEVTDPALGTGAEASQQRQPEPAF
jgi:hypothetical protein